jgi:hypothetical protein
VTALDIALDNIRVACLADQDRMQGQMAFTVSSLQEDKKQLQVKMLEQQALIGELQAKLKRSEQDLTRLGEKATTSAKYVAGVQRDYEKLQKSTDTFQKENKRALQNQIAEILEVRGTLQREYKLATEAASKSQKAMMRTMQETHMHYVMALKREKDLEDRLSEEVRLYEEEKSRRVELEKQVLPSLWGMQRQLKVGSAALSDKLSSLQAALGLHRTENGNNSNTKDCLQILQKLQSLPFLTLNDVRKAEGMLRLLHERWVFINKALLLR